MSSLTRSRRASAGPAPVITTTKACFSLVSVVDAIETHEQSPSLTGTLRVLDPISPMYLLAGLLFAAASK